jgi:molybdate transport system substrate-binding protein
MKPALIFLLLALALSAQGAEVKVAAASDLSFALRDLTAEFTRQTGHTVRVTLGSSGNLYSQLQNGAPFDVFMSADAQYPHNLAEAGLGFPDTEYAYGQGSIVVWVPQDSKLDPNKLHERILLDPAVIKIAIANPKHAPYGRAAEAAMKTLGIYDQVSSKLVLGENISQAAQFVQTGHAQAGVIALSLALSPQMKESGKYWEIPSDAYPPIVQAAVVMKSSSEQNAARAFVSFLKTASARAVFARYGFRSATN